MKNNEVHKNKVGSRIRVIRNELGLTMKEFGKKFNPPASDSIVSRWERGISLPNEERLKKISELGNISMFYLMTGEKVWNDLTNSEQENSFIDTRDDFKKSNDKMRKDIKKDIERLFHSDLSYLESIYLNNVLQYLKYSNDEDVKMLAAFITNLNRYKEAGEADDVIQSELLEFIESETAEYKKFLKQRYHYKDDK